MNPARALALASVVFIALSCSTSTASDQAATAIALGTWGGEGSGVIVNDTLVHVHIACTKGDFVRPATLDAQGRFDVAGSYQPRAYPVERGPTVPAHFTGIIRGDRLTISVVVDDTIAGMVRTFGPVVAYRGRQPGLGPCPICASPEAMRRNASGR